MRIWCFLYFVLMFSCGSSENLDAFNLDKDSLENNNFIVEYDMNPDRLSAVEFNNELTLVQEQMLDLISVLFQSDSSTVDHNLENILFEIDLTSSRLKSSNVPNSGNDYLNKVLALLSFYKDELTGNFSSSIIPILKKEKLTEKEIKKLNDYDLNFAEREHALFDSIFAAQDKFAKHNNIKLEE